MKSCETLEGEFCILAKKVPPNLGKSFNPLLANLIHAHIIYLINYVICLNNVDNNVVLFYFFIFWCLKVEI